ncbi:MAG: shikimate kinase [Cyanobacteria bacterium P01_F01_bin.42]
MSEIPNLKGVNLFLIGMMGAGKSTTAQILAETFDYRFFDTDTLVEQLADQTVDEIFAQSGEATFRALEAQVLAELSSYRQLAVATGGGIVLNPMNWSYLRHGLVVWLNADADTLWSRLKDDCTRPLLKTADPFVTLKDKLEQRTSLYQQADVEVAVPQDSAPEAIAQQVIEAVKLRLRQDEPPSEVCSS